MTPEPSVRTKVENIEPLAAGFKVRHDRELGEADLATCIRWLKSRGLSYAGLANILGVTRGAVWRWAHGYGVPKAAHGLFIRNFTAWLVEKLQEDDQP